MISIVFVFAVSILIYWIISTLYKSIKIEWFRNRLKEGHIVRTTNFDGSVFKGQITAIDKNDVLINNGSQSLRREINKVLPINNEGKWDFDIIAKRFFYILLIFILTLNLWFLYESKYEKHIGEKVSIRADYPLMVIDFNAFTGKFILSDGTKVRYSLVVDKKSYY